MPMTEPDQSKRLSLLRNLIYAVFATMIFWFFQMIIHVLVIGIYWVVGKIGFGAISEFDIVAVPLWIRLMSAGVSAFFGLMVSFLFLQKIVGLDWDKRHAAILIFVSLLPIIYYSIVLYPTWSAALPSLILVGVSIVTLPEYWKRPGYSV